MKPHCGTTRRKPRPILVLFHNLYLSKYRKGRHRVRISIQLECGCATIYPSPIPMYGDKLLCPIHGVTVRVPSPEWFLKCQNCRYSKGFGEAPVTVEVKASAHSTKRGHTVKVWRRIGSRVDREYTVPSQPREPLPIMASDVPPF